MLSGLEQLLGLPLHPLVVHAVVVLIPLTSVGAVLAAAWPAFSRRFGVLLVVLAWIATVSSWLAEESGEQLARVVGAPSAHVIAAEPLPPVAFGFAVVMTAFWLFDRGVPGNRSRPWWLRLLAVALAVVAVIAIALAVQAGHTGAVAVWSN